MAAGLHGNPYQEELIRLLLNRGADPSIRNLENDQPAHLLQSGDKGEKVRGFSLITTSLVCTVKTILLYNLIMALLFLINME